MVKVVPLQALFERQKIVNMEQEPSHICRAHDSFLVATVDGAVYAISAGAEYVVLHRFRTVVGPVLALHYMPRWDAVVSVEREREGSQIRVVRVYTSWRGGCSSGAAAAAATAGAGRGGRRARARPPRAGGRRRPPTAPRPPPRRRPPPPPPRRRGVPPPPPAT